MANKKISEFITASIIQSGDYLNIVRASTNYKVSADQLAPFLGAVGTIQPVGAGGSIPVLEQPTATSNNIRGIESGSGILASISPQNGITIKHNFTVNKTGSALIVDETVSSPIFRSLVAGDGIAIAASGNTIRISASVVGGSNTVIVNQESDFPSASGGVITLEDNTNYIISAAVSTANRFVLGKNNAITANNEFSPTLTYTGTGTMFTGTNVTFTMDRVNLDAPTGDIFNLSKTDPTKNVYVILTNFAVNRCLTFATVNDIDVFDVVNSKVFDCTKGIVASGSTYWDIFSLTRFFIASTSASFIGVDLGTSTHQTLELIDLIVRAPAGAIALKGAAASANLTTGNLATVTNCEFSGGLTPLDTIANSDIRWDFKGNTGIADTISDALLGFDGNATETVITVTSTPVKVNAVWVLEDAKKFTTDTTGRATYKGERGAHLPVDISLGVLAAGGGSKDVKIYIAKNGSVISNTGRTVQTSGSVPRTISIPWQLTFAENDYIEIYIANTSDTTNIIVQNAVMRIN